MKGAWIIIANIEAKDGQAPEWILLFKEGWNEIEGEGKFLVDRQAYDIVAKNVSRRGNDVVFDYEHQTLKDVKAPASGWLKELRYDDKIGFMAKIDWTEEAAEYIAKNEYRYFSPVFFVSKSNKRVVDVHSVALTNTPKINHLHPLLAKLGANLQEEKDMDFLKKIIAKLGLAEDASEEKVMEAVVVLLDKEPVIKEKEVIAKDVLAALDLKDGDDTSVVVASIHALKQSEKGVVSKDEFDKLQARLQKRDADEIVAKALATGKITPDQIPWASEYAGRDLKGFEVFVTKAPVVMPLHKLPSHKDEVDANVLDEATQTVAKMMDVSAEDIKKYG